MAKRKRFLRNVAADREFFVADGRVVRNLLEMADALMNMDQETFAVHVNKEKNDFRNWVRDAIGETDLASLMDQSQDRNELAALTLRTIVERR